MQSRYGLVEGSKIKDNTFSGLCIVGATTSLCIKSMKGNVMIMHLMAEHRKRIEII